MTISTFRATDGRLFSTALIEAAIPLEGGRWRVMLRGDRLPVEVNAIDAGDMQPGRLVRAARGDLANDATGRARRVLFYRVARGEAVAVFAPDQAPL